MSTASYKTTTTTVCFVLETMLAHPCFWRRTIYQHLSAITFYQIFQAVSLLFALHQDVFFFETGFFLPKTEWSRPTSIDFLNTSFHRDCPIFCHSRAVSIWERTDLVPLGDWRKASTASSGEAQVGWDPLPVTFTTLTTLGYGCVQK